MQVAPARGSEKREAGASCFIFRGKRDVLEKIAEALARIETNLAVHDARTTQFLENVEKLNEQQSDILEKQAEILLQLNFNVKRFGAIVENFEKNGTERSRLELNNLIKYLVLAVILAALGSQKIRLRRHPCFSRVRKQPQVRQDLTLLSVRDILAS